MMIPNDYPSLNFDLGDTVEMIRDSVRAFTSDHIAPRAAEIDRSNEFPRDLWPKLGELGLLGITVEEELGGAGMGYLEHCVAMEEISRASASVGLSYGAHSNLCVNQIRRNGSPAQKGRYLPKLISGEHVGALAMSEPGAGSDVRSMKCRAERDGEHFVINGTKHFISQADWADYVILFAATGEEEGPRGPRKKITSFIVDKGAPGFEVRPGYNSVSHRGYHNFVLNFDDCRLHESQVLGDVDHGFDVANQWLAATRLSVAACSLGQARRAHEMAVDWSATRKQFGQTIGRFQGVSFKLADMALQIKAAELLTLEAAWKLDRGTMTDSDAAMAKLHATETLAMVTDEAIQIHGGMGLMDELPLERFWRDARVERIWEGTSEIQRHIISRALLRPLES